MDAAFAADPRPRFAGLVSCFDFIHGGPACPARCFENRPVLSHRRNWVGMVALRPCLPAQRASERSEAPAWRKIWCAAEIQRGSSPRAESRLNFPAASLSKSAD